MKKYILSFLWVINHPNNKGNPVATILRILKWKYNQFFIGKSVIVEILDGVRFKCYTDSSWGGLVVYTKLPEYYEMMFAYNIATQGDIIIDVGANPGDYSLIAASKIKSGKVYAFEPSRKSYARLLENIKLNNYENKIKTFNMAVSDVNGVLNFTDEPRSEVSHVSYSDKTGNAVVESISLDNFVMKLKNKHIKLIKIDVEGYEYKVLKGAEIILRKGLVDYILFELNRDSFRYNIPPQKTIKFLEMTGYKIFLFGDSFKLIPLKKLNYRRKSVNLLAIHKNVGNF